MDKQVEEVDKVIIEYIPRLKVGIMEVAELFQKYEENKGTALLCEVIEGLQWFIDTLVIIHKLNEENILEINDKLNEIVTALGNEDYILVGDLLQYEIIPVIEEVESNLI